VVRRGGQSESEQRVPHLVREVRADAVVGGGGIALLDRASALLGGRARVASARLAEDLADRKVRGRVGVMVRVKVWGRVGVMVRGRVGVMV
jgi:hypothetical protein